MSHRAKVLYAIQGTGNGHVSRARALYPKLIESFDVDLALVGKNSDVQLPVQPVWKGRGVSMEYSKRGRVDVLKTMLSNSPIRIWEEMRDIPVCEYDFIINDFESISLRAAKRYGVPVIGVSHQAAVSNPKSPKAKVFMPFGKFILKHYAPVSHAVGFHFKPYAEDILPPLLDGHILQGEYLAGEHVVVYTPAYGLNEIRKALKSIPRSFKVFHRDVTEVNLEGNIIWNSIDGDSFKNALLRSKAVICSAGFELPSECLHHGIPLVVIPIQGQYEQWCNAFALKEIGVESLKKLNSSNLSEALNRAVSGPLAPAVFPDVSGLAVERIKTWWEEMRK